MRKYNFWDDLSLTLHWQEKNSNYQLNFSLPHRVLFFRARLQSIDLLSLFVEWMNLLSAFSSYSSHFSKVEFLQCVVATTQTRDKHCELSCVVGFNEALPEWWLEIQCRKKVFPWPALLGGNENRSIIIMYAFSKAVAWD